MSRPSAVVDTNIFVSALILPLSRPSQLLSAWRKDKFILVTFKPLLTELEEVLRLQKYGRRYGVKNSIRRQLLKWLQRKAVMVSSPKHPDIGLRDPKDVLVLATAMTGKADFLVTGDKDLLVLEGDPKIGKLHIVNLEKFLEIVDSLPHSMVY